MVCEEKIKEFVNENTEDMYATLKELCAIPAPSHHEEKRAEYCKKWLEEAGAEGVYIDEALNVVCPINCDNSSEITVIVAHTDTVFPDTEPMPVVDDGKKIHSPGAGDDTAQLTVMMEAAKFFVQNKIKPEKGILIVCNSCEEGLGNLKGTRKIFADFEGRIKQFISFDSNLDSIADKCVGSHRYEVTVKTEGGHSFGAFGNANAIAKLAEIITKIYEIKLPEIDGSKTTYNVGTIFGGTSVNTIAQSASMLCEYRSDDRRCLAIMEEEYAKIFEASKSEECEIEIKKVGDRPCSNTPPEKLDYLKDVCRRNIEAVIGKQVRFKASSTDCNIPLSLGVPAVCMGVIYAEGAHRREEWVDKSSMILGLEAAIKTMLEISEINY